MKNFQLFRYLKKWMPLIVVFFVVMTALSYRVLQSRQRYTASAVIEYKAMQEEGEEGADPKDGLAPDGTKIDVSEIYSSANMAKVMSNLGLSYSTYSLDALCASIRVEPIQPEEEKDEKKDDEKDKEPETPTSYVVSCTLDSSASRALVRDILNELLDVYFSDYSSKHINVEQVNNQTRDLMDTDYDYLEMVERINAQLTDTLWALDARYRRAKDFRSTDTGYSFWDLCDQFSLIQQLEVPKLYSLVLGNQITKDRELMINKYQNRIANHHLTSSKAQEDIAAALEIIRSYVDKMRRSGNTDIDYNYILNDIHEERWETGNLVDRTVEYDELLTNWVDYRNRWNNAVVDTAYCEYIIGVYQNGDTSLTLSSPAVARQTQAAGTPEAEQPDEAAREGEDGQADGDTQQDGSPQEDEVPEAEPPVEPPPASIEPYSPGSVGVEEVQEEIRAVLEKMNGLYDTVMLTNIEYNEYLGAQAIRMLSSASVSSAINLKLYIMVIAAFFLLVGCGGAVLLGRAGDILEYLFLRDRLTGCMNRPSCDNYIDRWKERPLSADMCCCNIQITNQREMNDAYGRERVDQAMKEFGRVLRELYENRKNGFVGYNGSGQFWAFFEKEAHETVEREVERLTLVLSQTMPDIALEYQMGAANAGALNQFWIRNLISQAVKGRRPYQTSDSAKEEVRQ